MDNPSNFNTWNASASTSEQKIEEKYDPEDEYECSPSKKHRPCENGDEVKKEETVDVKCETEDVLPSSQESKSDYADRSFDASQLPTLVMTQDSRTGPQFKLSTYPGGFQNLYPTTASSNILPPALPQVTSSRPVAQANLPNIQFTQSNVNPAYWFGATSSTLQSTVATLDQTNADRPSGSVPVSLLQPNANRPSGSVPVCLLQPNATRPSGSVPVCLLQPNATRPSGSVPVSLLQPNANRPSGSVPVSLLQPNATRPSGSVPVSLLQPNANRPSGSYPVSLLQPNANRPSLLHPSTVPPIGLPTASSFSPTSPRPCVVSSSQNNLLTGPPATGQDTQIQFSPGRILTNDSAQSIQPTGSSSSTEKSVPSVEQPLSVDTKNAFPLGYIVPQTSAENMCEVCRRVTHIDDDSEQQASNPSPQSAYSSKVEKDRIFKWIQCDECNVWLHLKCAGLEEWESEVYDKFYCSKCQPIKGPNKLHDKLAPHRYRYYSKEEIPLGTQLGTEEWCKMWEKTEANKFPVPPTADEVVLLDTGHQFMDHFYANRDWNKVYLVKNRDGLCMCMPDPGTFDLEDIMNIVGENTTVDTIDVYRQDTYSMKFGTFVKKMRDPERPRYKLYNILSLEFSDYPKMREKVAPPCIVSEISFVHRLWPEDGVPYQEHMHVLEEHIPMKPKVAEFCLAGMGGSYTDYHIDFGGSSVWYHIYKGQKIFYIVKPTKENLRAYEKYQAEHTAETTFDTYVGVENIKRVVISEGETLMVPSGWIHAVYTPVDSLVFGGNFLHMANVPMQLEIYNLENRIRSRAPADEKFFFPNFEFVNWYAVSHFLTDTLRECNDEGNVCDEISWKAALAYAGELPKWIEREEKRKEANTEVTAERAVSQEIVAQLSKNVKKQEKIRKEQRKKSGGKKRKSKDDDTFRSWDRNDGKGAAEASMWRATRNSPEPPTNLEKVISPIANELAHEESHDVPKIKDSEFDEADDQSPSSSVVDVMPIVKFQPPETETTAQIFAKKRSSSGRRIQVTSAMKDFSGEPSDEPDFNDKEVTLPSISQSYDVLEKAEKAAQGFTKAKKPKGPVSIPKEAPKPAKKAPMTAKQRLAKKLKF